MDARVVSYGTFDWGDFYATLIFEGLKIAIYSAGDAKSLFKGGIDYGEEEGADILVGVLSKGKHYSEVLEGYEENKDYFWFHLPFEDEIEEKSINENHLIMRVLEKMYTLMNNTNTSGI